MEEKETEVETPVKKPEIKKSSKIAVILIRGTIGLNHKKKDTLKMLNLLGKFNCVILTDNPVNKGMILKMKDHVTWGEISDDTIKELDAKRPKGEKKQYRLHPPRGGLRSSKKNFKDGGALGPRKEKINDFLKKMM